MATRTEDVLVKMGLDNTAVNRGLVDLQGAFKSFGGDLVKQFSGMFAAGAVIAGLNRILQKVNEIQDRAENIGVSTDFVQGIQVAASNNAASVNKGLDALNAKIGEAREGNRGAVEDFQRLGITIQDIFSNDTEQMFYLISDHLRKMPDPSERAAAAIGVFGKSAKDSVGFLAQGSDQIKKMVDGAEKLKSVEIERLELARKSVEATQNTLTIWAGKAVAMVGGIAELAGRITSKISVEFTPNLYFLKTAWNVFGRGTSGGQKSQSHMDGAKQAAVVEAKLNEDMLKKQNEHRQQLADAQSELDKKAEIRALNEQGLLDGKKAKELQIKAEQIVQQKLQERMTDSSLSDVEILKLQTQVEESKTRSLEAQRDLEKEIANEKEKQAKTTKDLADKTDEMNARLREQRQTVQDLRDREGDRFKLTVRELAQVKFRGRSTTDARSAQEALSLESKAKQSAGLGNLEAAYGYQSQADAILGRLGQLKSNELPDMNKTLERQEQKLEKMLEAMTKKGIKIQSEEDEKS